MCWAGYRPVQPLQIIGARTSGGPEGPGASKGRRGRRRKKKKERKKKKKRKSEKVKKRKKEKEKKRKSEEKKEKRRISEKGLTPTFLCTQDSNPYLDVPLLVMSDRKKMLSKPSNFAHNLLIVS